MLDTFLGQAFILAPPDQNHDPTRTIITSHTLSLVGKKKHGQTEVVPGELTLEYETYQDLHAI